MAVAQAEVRSLPCCFSVSAPNREDLVFPTPLFFQTRNPLSGMSLEFNIQSAHVAQM